MRAMSAMRAGIKLSFRIFLCLLLTVPVTALNRQNSQNAQTPAAPQSQNIEAKVKTLTKVVPIDGDTEPVRVVCQTFPQEDDWLKHLKIEVENISGKPIDYLEFVAIICEIKNVDYCVAIPLVYGKVGSTKITIEDINSAKPLGSNIKPKTAEPQAQSIPPGGKVKLTVTEAAFNSAKKTIEKSASLSTIHSADLLVGRTHHTDGSGWYNESMLADGILGKYNSDSNAYLVAKQGYVWGYLRDRKNVQGDIYAGPAYQEDDKGDKSRVQGFNRKLPRSGRRVVVFSSGGG